MQDTGITPGASVLIRTEAWGKEAGGSENIFDEQGRVGRMPFVRYRNNVVSQDGGVPLVGRQHAIRR
jgi:hypothetical protein